MEFNQILELIDHVSASELTAFTYETADLTLSMEHGKPQIIQGVIGETVENIPAVGMTGGKVRRAVNTAPVASFVSGCLACKWMINIVKKGKLIYFAIYCAIAGVITLILS